ncbi:alpha/beta hydrolase [Lichenicola sp.]|uniref:alpha/beta hydrolase n=1 Tax=Lichenicola sp. TaxID=2804529 RepID=UPI003AFF7520
MTDETEHQITRADGTRLQARHLPGRSPTIVFLPGLRSDMNGDKAEALVRFARTRGQAMLRLDYSGHGASGGRFDEGSIAVWRDDAIAIIEALAPGPLVLVGSSMGGWIGLMIARMLDAASRGRLHGLVGIAAAPDFTRAFLSGLSADARAALQRDGRVVLPAEPDPLVLTARAIEDGEACSVLDGPIAITCPVRLLHGQRDDVVPWMTALRIAEGVASPDCQVVLVKDGDHRLSRPQDLVLLQATVAGLLDR